MIFLSKYRFNFSFVEYASFLVSSLNTVKSFTSGLTRAGPTHVLVVRGLDENVSEETLRHEFSKYAPIKVLPKSPLL